MRTLSETVVIMKSEPQRKKGAFPIHKGTFKHLSDQLCKDMVLL